MKYPRKWICSIRIAAADCGYEKNRHSMEIYIDPEIEQPVRDVNELREKMLQACTTMFQIERERLSQQPCPTFLKLRDESIKLNAKRDI